MGNTKSNTANARHRKTPIRPILKRPPVIGPVSAYNPYPPAYIPQTFSEPPYTAQYPGYPPTYLPFAPTEYRVKTSQSHHKVPEQHTPSRVHYADDPHGHLNLNQSLPDHHHRHHQHHHHHHHHRPSITEREPFTIPVVINPAIPTSLPARHQPAFVVQNPTPQLITYEVPPPTISRAVVVPTSAYRPPSVVIHRPVTSIVARDSPIIDVAPQYQISPPTIFQPVSTPTLVKMNSFEKAPIIETRFIPKSPDHSSVRSYGPTMVPIVRRSASHSTTPGNRWYDHNYDKRITPLSAVNI